MTETLKDKAINGMIWTSIDRFGSQFVQFIIGILIARILSPSDYGIIGILAIFMALSNTLIDSGFGSALIQNKNRTQTDYSTAFYFNGCIGILLYLILYISAPYIASFYDIPILCQVTRIYTLVLVFNSFTVVPITKLTVELDFKKQSIISISTQLVTGIIGLSFAYKGYGIWALVFQAVGAQFFRLVTIFCYTKWMPDWVFSLVSFKNMFSYGSKILCSSIINTVYSNINSLIIGKMYSVSDVGYYNKGKQFPFLVSGTLLTIVMKVAFPILSEVQDDNPKLRTAYLNFLRMPMFILLPALSCLIITAEPLIYLMLGEKWMPCVPFLQVLCLCAIFEPLTHINLNVLYVKGRTDLVLKLELIKKPIAFLIILISVQFGVIWLCLGQVIYAVIAYIINCHYTKNYIQLGIYKQIKNLTPIFLYALIASIISYCVITQITIPFWKITCGILINCGIYILLSYINKDQSFMEYMCIIKQKK